MKKMLTFAAVLVLMFGFFGGGGTLSEVIQTESMPSVQTEGVEEMDISKLILGNDEYDLQDSVARSALSKNAGMIHTDKNEISPSTGSVLKIQNGHVNINANPSGYWKTLIAPVDSLYIDGVATLKSGGLSGAQAHNIPTMVFMDENYDVVGTPVYSAIAAPHTFTEADIPSGAVYVGCCYSNQFVFAFNSISSQIKQNKEEIAKINEQFEEAGKYEIDLAFSSATGYYNGAKGYTTYEGVTAAEVAASAGDVFFLTSRNYYGMARVAFMNEGNTCIAVLYTGNNATNIENTRFVVPENTANILIQTVYGYPCTLWKASVKEKIDSLDNEVVAIKNATTEAETTPVSLTFESATGYRDKNGAMATYSGVTIAEVPVTEGQKYILKSRNYYNAAYAYFADSEKAFLRSLWLANNAQEISVEILIPAGVSYLVVQRVYAFYPTELGLITGVEKIPVKSILNGKKLTLIGDSITEKNFRARVNWAMNLHTWCGAIIQNLGVGGTGFKAGVTQSKNYYARLSQIQESPDIIGVALSWNDMGDTSFPIGTATDTGTESLAGYANDFLDALIAAYPTTPIISYSQGPWWSYHPGVARSDEWISVYKQICAFKGIPFYSDLYDGCTLKPWLLASRQKYYTSDDPDAGNTGVVDDVHPNSEGHKVIARILYPKFVQNLVTTGIDYE